MNFTLKLWLRSLALGIVLLSLRTATVQITATSPVDLPDIQDQLLMMKDPAAVYCAEVMGYNHEVVTMPDGSQYGLCQLPDGNTCNEWNFYAGTCGEAYTYCAEAGYHTETRDDGADTFAATYAVCITQDGKEIGSISQLTNLAAHATSSQANTVSVSPLSPTPLDRLPSAITAPPSFDWRNYNGSNWLTGVKNQGNICGSCWAFAAVGVTEAHHNIIFSNPDLDLNLAEQDIVSCSGAGGCGGGWTPSALHYIAEDGVVDEACFPYQASDVACSKCAGWTERLTHIDSFRAFQPDIASLKETVVTYGPTYVSMGIDSDYGGYFDSNRVYHCNDDSGTNHAVVVVGYNDSGNYWLVRNSWGSDWNGDGYFKVGYGECAIDSTIAGYVYTIPPVTTVTLSGSSGYNGWYATDVIVTLTADEPVAWTRYRVDSGDWQVYNAPFVLSSAGTHLIEYYSRDKFAAEETPKSTSVKIDKTPPIAASDVRPSGWTGPYTGDTTPAFAWNAATDSDSGFAGYYVAVDDHTPDGSGGNDWWAGNVTTFNVPGALPEGQHRFAVTSKDNAGNTNPVDGGSDAPYYLFSVDINPPTIPQITISGPGCSGIPNNGWQNTCYTPTFSWTSSDSVSGVKDYRYYWGTSASGVPATVTTTTTFAPGVIAPAGSVASMYFNLTARDSLNHESGRASFGVRYDGAPPTVTLVINGGGETTNQVNVWLDLTVADAGSGVDQMRFSNNGLEWTAWEAYSSSKPWRLPALDRRAHTLYAQVRDRAGNASSVASDSITLDFYPVAPHSASFRICDAVVDIGGSGELTSVSFHLVSAIGQSWATGATANSSAGHTARSGFLAALDGCRPITHSVTTNYTVTQWVVASGGNLRGSSSFRLGDTAGQPAASGNNAFTSTSFTLSSGFWAQITGTVPMTTPVEPTPPPPTPMPIPTPGPTSIPQPGSFGVSINDGALYTHDPDVTVNTWAPDVTQVRLSNDGGYADAGWTTYQLTHTWTISTYGAYVMPRIVYAWFKDAQAAVYGPFQDDIVYDPVAPQGSVRIAGVTLQRLNPTAVVTLHLEASDDNSGVAAMRLGEDTLENATWQPFSDTVTRTLQSDIVYVQFQDNAGNLSALYGSDSSEHALASPLLNVTLSGPTLGLTHTAYTFTADVSSVTATLPITYLWQVTGQTPITHAATLNTRSILSFTWGVAGTQMLTVTALNKPGMTTGTHSITIMSSTPSCAHPMIGVDIQPAEGGMSTFYMDTLYSFVAIPSPLNATQPITYTWSPIPYNEQGNSVAIYQWSAPGTYTITLTTQDCGGIPVTTQKVVTVQTAQHRIYLPLVLRE